MHAEEFDLKYKFTRQTCPLFWVTRVENIVQHVISCVHIHKKNSKNSMSRQNPASKAVLNSARKRGLEVRVCGKWEGLWRGTTVLGGKLD